MKKGKLERPIVVLSVTAAVIFAGLYIKEITTFPVAYKVCGVGYTDCKTVAKFDDRDSCETTNQRWSWYCDQTDKNSIVCEEKESDIATSYCD